MIKDLIKHTKDKYINVLPRGQFWEFLKLRIKEHTINYCTQKAISRKDEIAELEYKISKIDIEIANQIYSNELQEERKTLKRNLDELYISKAKGAQVRSRVRWIEEGEKSTNYFLNLEKQRQSANVIDKLKYNGKEEDSDEGILQICTSFYQDLFSSQNIKDNDIDHYLEDISLQNILTETEKEKCEGKITTKECFNALTQMQRNKSPGVDGIIIEFYQQFWELL